MSPSQSLPPKKTARTKQPKLSPLRKPEGLSLEEWQRQLRREFGREQKFRLRNLGDRAAFSEFLVNNPQSRNTYRVVIRGRRPGENSWRPRPPTRGARYCKSGPPCSSSGLHR
jgi:hypothetical protein